MAKYRYVAKDISSKKHRGVLVSNSTSELADTLRNDGLFLVDVQETLESTSKSYHFKSKDLSSFCREIGTMLSSGISIVRTFDIMVQRENNKKIRKVYADIYAKLQEGYTLSNAMKSNEGSFPELLIAMVRSGESTGGLDKTMIIMAEHYEKSSKLQGRTKTAMYYPIILLVVTLVVLMIVFVFVLPSFFDLFKGVELPLITKINIAISKFMVQYWYFVLLAIVIFIALMKLIFKMPKPRYYFDKLKLKLPKVGKLLKIIYTARFARTLCSLYSSGVSIVNSLNIVKETVGNKYIEAQFNDAIEMIRSGETLSSAINSIDGFDIKLVSSIYIGEESGRLENTLTTLADNFDYESEQATERLVALAQPIMIIFLAVIICIIVVSVLVPIYQIYNSIG